MPMVQTQRVPNWEVVDSLVAHYQFYSIKSERLDTYACFSDSANKHAQASQNGAETKTIQSRDSNVNSMTLKLNILGHAHRTQHKECWLGGN